MSCNDVLTNIPTTTGGYPTADDVEIARRHREDFYPCPMPCPVAHHSHAA